MHPLSGGQVVAWPRRVYQRGPVRRTTMLGTVKFAILLARKSTGSN
jgi:hypothetical protein